MEFKTYFRSQIETARYLNEVINKYWSGTINENDLKFNIKNIVKNNRNKIFQENEEFTTIIQQRCGKKRLELLQKIISIEE